jgi:hypothetical protein
MTYINVQNYKNGKFERNTIPLHFSLDTKGHLILTLTDIKTEQERKIRCHERKDGQVIVNAIKKLYEVFEE